MADKCLNISLKPCEIKYCLIKMLSLCGYYLAGHSVRGCFIFICIFICHFGFIRALLH